MLKTATTHQTKTKSDTPAKSSQNNAGLYVAGGLLLGLTALLCSGETPEAAVEPAKDLGEAFFAEKFAYQSKSFVYDKTDQVAYTCEADRRIEYGWQEVRIEKYFRRDEITHGQPNFLTIKVFQDCKGELHFLFPDKEGKYSLEPSPFLSGQTIDAGQLYAERSWTGLHNEGWAGHNFLDTMVRYFKAHGVKNSEALATFFLSELMRLYPHRVEPVQRLQKENIPKSTWWLDPDHTYTIGNPELPIEEKTTLDIYRASPRFIVRQFNIDRPAEAAAIAGVTASYDKETDTFTIDGIKVDPYSLKRILTQWILTEDHPIYKPWGASAWQDPLVAAEVLTTAILEKTKK
jgi:hypothetical protein